MRMKVILRKVNSHKATISKSVKCNLATHALFIILNDAIDDHCYIDISYFQTDFLEVKSRSGKSQILK